MRLPHCIAFLTNLQGHGAVVIKYHTEILTHNLKHLLVTVSANHFAKPNPDVKRTEIKFTVQINIAAKKSSQITRTNKDAKK